MFDFETMVDRRKSMSAKWQEISRSMGEGSDDVIALSVADMEFKPAPAIVEALVDAAQHDIFGYDYVTDEYFDALNRWMTRRHHCSMKKEWVSVSDGVMPAINVALRAFTHPGDQVIIQRPVYYPFTAAVERTGLQVANNPLVWDDETSRFVINVDELETLASQPRTTAMVLCSPHNPVGRVWSADELKRIADICFAHDVTLLVDEIHADFERPGHPVTLFGQLPDEYANNVIEFTAPTKTFNIAGMLVSNVIIRDPQNKQRFDVAAENIGGLTVSHFGLVACIAAYTRGEAWFDELCDVLETNRVVLRDFVQSTDGVQLVEPEGTYLAWIDCRGLGFATQEELRDFFHQQARVFFDEGTLFGPEALGYERINLALPTAKLNEVLERMGEAIAIRMSETTRAEEQAAERTA